MKSDKEMQDEFEYYWLAAIIIQNISKGLKNTNFQMDEKHGNSYFNSHRYELIERWGLDDYNITQ
jgi:hypothetical protein